MANILIVDDNTTILLLLTQQLKPYGYDIQTATNGKEALQIALSQSVDLVLIDYNMPIMNGMDLFKQLKIHLSSPPPAIMMTTNASLEVATEFLKADGTDFFEKGIDGWTLNLKVQHAITTSQRLRAEQQKRQATAKKLRKTNLLLVEKTEQLEQTNKELAQQAQRLQQQSEELQQSNKELQQFTDIVAHDLKEPLRGIANALQFLREDYRDELDEQATEYINFAISGAQRLNYMIQGLAQYANVNAVQPFVTVDCNAILKAVEKNLKLKIQENQAKIIYPNLPTLTGHKYQLIQLFQNLISNAIKFRQAAPPVITIAIQSLPNYWQFSVADNGIGFEQTYANRIFEIFHRLHTHQTYQGSGIGLSICKKIVTRHEGEIWVTSIPKKGSTFYFTIKKGLA